METCNHRMDEHTSTEAAPKPDLETGFGSPPTYKEASASFSFYQLSHKYCTPSNLVMYCILIANVVFCFMIFSICIFENLELEARYATIPVTNDLNPSVISAPLTLFHKRTPRSALTERMGYMWVQLASLTNVSTFCLTTTTDMHTLLGTCLYPVCTPLSVMLNHTSLRTFLTGTQMKYSNAPNWGTVSSKLPVNAVSLFTPYVASGPNVSCACVTGCDAHAKKTSCITTGTGNWTCGHYEEISFYWAHVILPPGWFFTCGQHTFNYIPANLSDTQCCLSRLTALLPTKADIVHHSRSPRDAVLDNACDDHVHLFNKAEYVSLATSIIGIPALAIYNHWTSHRIACSLAKTINATSIALAALNQEQVELRHAVLDNRAAIDYLLLLHHVGCESVRNMCCFNISDNSLTVQKQMDTLKQLASQIREEIVPEWWKGLWSWLPDVSWLRSIASTLIMIVALLVALCCFVQCIPSLLVMLRNMLQRKTVMALDEENTSLLPNAPLEEAKKKSPFTMSMSELQQKTLLEDVCVQDHKQSEVHTGLQVI